MRLLFVDSDHFFLEQVKKEIDWKRLKIKEMETADSVENAKRKLSDHKIDILIVSLELSGENGLDFMEWMQKKDARTIRILISAKEDFKSVVKAMHCGVSAYLKKPIVQEELVKSIKEAEIQIQKYDLQHNGAF